MRAAFRKRASHRARNRGERLRHRQGRAPVAAAAAAPAGCGLWLQLRAAPAWCLLAAPQRQPGVTIRRPVGRPAGHAAALHQARKRGIAGRGEGCTSHSRSISSAQPLQSACVLAAHPSHLGAPAGAGTPSAHSAGPQRRAGRHRRRAAGPAAARTAGPARVRPRPAPLQGRPNHLPVRGAWGRRRGCV